MKTFLKFGPTGRVARMGLAPVKKFKKNLNLEILKLDYNYEHIFEVLAHRAGRLHGASPGNEIFWKFQNKLEFDNFEVRL